MSIQDFPTTYELCRIAVALRSKEAAENPKKAVKEAMALWFAAFGELHHVGEAAQESPEETIARLHAERNEERKAPLIPIELASEDGKTSEAMKWINENAGTHDRFKSISRFKAAWLKAHPGDKNFYGFGTTVDLLATFLAGRVARRRAVDAERKRRDRKPQQKFSKAPKKNRPRTSGGSGRTPH